MSSSETIDNAIRFARGLEAVIGDLCDNCKQRIRQELKSRGAGRSAIPSQHISRRSEPDEPITEGHYYEVQAK
jgi:hypothetical protein